MRRLILDFFTRNVNTLRGFGIIIRVSKEERKAKRTTYFRFDPKADCPSEPEIWRRCAGGKTSSVTS